MTGQMFFNSTFELIGQCSLLTVSGCEVSECAPSLVVMKLFGTSLCAYLWYTDQWSNSIDGEEYLGIAESIYEHLVKAARHWGPDDNDIVIHEYTDARDGASSSDDGSPGHGRRAVRASDAGGKHGHGRRSERSSSDVNSIKPRMYRSNSDGGIVGRGEVDGVAARQGASRRGGVERAHRGGGHEESTHGVDSTDDESGSGSDSPIDDEYSDHEGGGGTGGGAGGGRGAHGRAKGDKRTSRSIGDRSTGLGGGKGGRSPDGASGRGVTGARARSGTEDGDDVLHNRRQKLDRAGGHGHSHHRDARESACGDVPGHKHTKRGKLDVGWRHHKRELTYVLAVV